MYTLGGAPGIGKTTFVLSLMKQIAERKIPIAFFSYEQTVQQVINRFIAIETDFSYEKLSRNNLREDEMIKIHSSINKLKNLPIFIDSSPRLKVNDLALQVRELKEKKNIQLLVVDDIQRMTIDDFSREYAANREQEISSNVRELKRLARELNIPILIISQLNRMFEARYDKRPILIDLRDSGAIENDSDVVMFLYRAEHYGLNHNEDGESNIGMAEIMVSKNRHGYLDTIRLSFDREIPLFKDYKNHFDNGDIKSHFTTIHSKMSTDDSSFDMSDDPF